MLCRKAIVTREMLHGEDHRGMVRALLQMASIGAAQRLYDESTDHATQVRAGRGGRDGRDVRGEWRLGTVRCVLSDVYCQMCTVRCVLSDVWRPGTVRCVPILPFSVFKAPLNRDPPTSHTPLTMLRRRSRSRRRWAVRRAQTWPSATTCWRCAGQHATPEPQT